jgi:hypothetical protein
MLPSKDQLTICFAHVAYRLRERFLALGTGVESFEVRDGAALEQRIRDADVLVISGLWRRRGERFLGRPVERPAPPLAWPVVILPLRADRLTPSVRRFPPPWTTEETDACFIVRDANGQAFAYVYFSNRPFAVKRFQTIHYHSTVRLT